MRTPFALSPALSNCLRTLGLVASIACFAQPAHATAFTFDSDPFAGTPIRQAPGRQILASDLFLSFTSGADTFVFSPSSFGLSGPLNFYNGFASALPATGVNVIVLKDLDNDNNPLTPFGTSEAADLIAAHVTSPGPGLFIAFNSSIQLPRLVYSSDLSSTQADLAILARMFNQFGAQGQAALARYGAADFALRPEVSAVPEPATVVLALSGLGLCLVASRRTKGSSTALA